MQVCKKLFRRGLVLMLLLGLAACQPDVGLDQHGAKVRAQSLEGRWLVINYWATWCGPCRSEVPELNHLDKRVDQARIKVLGVNFDGLQGAELAAASAQLGIEFTVLAQDPAQRFGIERSAVLPITHIVAPDGTLRLSLAGEQSAAGLMAALKKLQE